MCVGAAVEMGLFTARATGFKLENKEIQGVILAERV